MCPKHEQNDKNHICLMNFINKIHARYFALIAVQIFFFFSLTHSLFSCQGTEKIKENGLHYHALKIVWF